MSDALLLALVLLGCIVSLVTAGALVEVFRHLAEIRNKLDLDDEPLVLDFQTRDLRTAPVAVPEAVDRASRTALVFMHGRCGTCRLVAEAFATIPESRAWFVLPAQDVDAAPAFGRLAATGRVFADRGEELAEYLGIDVAPTVVLVEDGRAERALGISTVRQVRAALAEHSTHDEHAEVVANVG